MPVQWNVYTIIMWSLMERAKKFIRMLFTLRKKNLVRYKLQSSIKEINCERRSDYTNIDCYELACDDRRVMELRELLSQSTARQRVLISAIRLEAFLASALLFHSRENLLMSDERVFGNNAFFSRVAMNPLAFFIDGKSSASLLNDKSSCRFCSFTQNISF